MEDKNYVLITPVKNEEKTISKVIDSVKKQTLKPKLWIIVNDGSTDKSQKIIEKNIKNIKWIKLINKVINKEYNWLGITKVLAVAEKYVFKNKIRYNFIGVLDSDITLEKDYFQKLVSCLNKNEEIGSISGEVFIKKEGKWIAEYKESKGPRGGARLYSNKAFNAIKGFPKTPSWDRISDIKLGNRKYKTIKKPKIKAYQHRISFGKVSSFKGHFLHGRGKYLLGYNFFHMALISISLMAKKKPYLILGLIFLGGYLTGFLDKRKKINDKEIIKFSRDFWKRIF